VDIKIGFGVHSSGFLSLLLLMKNIVSLHNNKSDQLNNNIIFYLTASKSNDYEGLK